MNILKERWKRLIISLFLGVTISKGLATITYMKVEISALLLSIISYLVLTEVYKKYERESENENENKIK